MGSHSMDIQCWKCGTALKNILLPFSRYEECSTCKADLHVCVACRHYDSTRSDSCREDRAEFVLDKDKANFCDYFKPSAKPYKKSDNNESREARAKLAALFGEQIEDEKEPGDNSPMSESDKALAELKRLFGDQD